MESMIQYHFKSFFSDEPPVYLWHTDLDEYDNEEYCPYMRALNKNDNLSNEDIRNEDY
jgi:hypothetical protein